MIVRGKEFVVIDGGNYWKIKRSITGVQVEYKISKKEVETLDALTAYIEQHPELF